MDIIHAIHNLQRKPDHVRRRILIISVAGTMAVIIGFWLMATSRRIEYASSAPTTKTTTKTESPFAMLKATAGEFGKIMGEYKEVFK